MSRLLDNIKGRSLCFLNRALWCK